jgi:hypothetical protein
MEGCSSDKKRPRRDICSTVHGPPGASNSLVTVPDMEGHPVCTGCRVSQRSLLPLSEALAASPDSRLITVVVLTAILS